MKIVCPAIDFTTLFKLSLNEGPAPIRYRLRNKVENVESYGLYTPSLVLIEENKLIKDYDLKAKVYIPLSLSLLTRTTQ